MSEEPVGNQHLDGKRDSRRTNESFCYVEGFPLHSSYPGDAEASVTPFRHLRAGGPLSPIGSYDQLDAIETSNSITEPPLRTLSGEPPPHEIPAASECAISPSIVGDINAAPLPGGGGGGVVTTLIPAQLPTSGLLYLLTTSEGRDKMMKLIQYILKFAISILQIRDLFPASAYLFTSYWIKRFSMNLTTIRNGRRLFKLGQWIINSMYMQEGFQQLMRIYRKERAMRRAAGGIRGILSESRADKYYQQANETQKQYIQGALDMGDSDEELNRGRELARTGDEAVRDVAKTLIISAQSELNAQRRSSKDVGSIPHGSPLDVPRIQRIRNANSAEIDVIRFSDSDRRVRLQPARSALAKNWKKPAMQASKIGLYLIILRSFCSVLRNVLRDLLFLADKELLAFRTNGNAVEFLSHHFRLFSNRNRLQSIVNKSWFVLVLVDFLMCAHRLLNTAWIARSMIPENKLYCQCNLIAEDVKGSCLYVRNDPFYIRTKEKISFPPLDLDHGAVLPTNAKFLEAADPSRLRPHCAVCGYVLQNVAEGTQGEETPKMGSRADNYSGERNGFMSPGVQFRLGDKDADSSSGSSFGMTEEERERENRLTLRRLLQGELERGRQVLILPLIIRRLYSLFWCCRNHANFFYSILFQIRCTADLFIASRYFFGDREPVIDMVPVSAVVEHEFQTSPVAAVAAATGESSAAWQRLLWPSAGSLNATKAPKVVQNDMLVAVSGIVSAGISLWRVIKVGS